MTEMLSVCHISTQLMSPAHLQWPYIHRPALTACSSSTALGCARQWFEFGSVHMCENTLLTRLIIAILLSSLKIIHSSTDRTWQIQ